MGYKMLNNFVTPFSREEYGFIDDFNEFTDAQRWTVAVAATGTATHAGSIGTSQFKLFGTAANDPATLATTHEIFKFRANKAMYCEGQVVFTDPNTDDGGLLFGWADAMAGTNLADTTGAIVINDSGAVLYKTLNQTVWTFHTEIAGAFVSTQSTTPAGFGVTQQLAIEIHPRSSTVLEARPFVDGEQLRDAAGNRIKHDITLGTSTDMDFGWVLKDFHADDMTALIDYCGAKQVR